MEMIINDKISLLFEYRVVRFYLVYKIWKTSHKIKFISKSHLKELTFVPFKQLHHNDSSRSF